MQIINDNIIVIFILLWYDFILRSKACLPYLKKSSNPHIVNISPPLNIKPIWFKNHIAYTISKYGMSMCAFGMAEEFKDDGIAVNTVWPKTGKLFFNCIIFTLFYYIKILYKFYIYILYKYYI